jgi:exopolysaccharide/PEP-CTERM locus tyrosine autokinase
VSSLIEQAAKRLEELRRAGVETPEGAAAPGETQPASLSTPEAMILALEARGHSQALAPRSRDERREAPTRREQRPAAEPDQSRRLEIDFARHKARGFVTPNDGSSQIADEFRVIKRPIIRNALGASAVRNGNLVMVTSALPGEGKTFTSLNLALSIATEIDSTVLLVDGDVAHPSIPEILSAPHGPGLLDLLTRDDLDFAEALLKTNVAKLSLLPAGSRHRRSTELLASAQMAALLRETASRYSDRIVIFDSPPLLATTEARVLAANMGQIVMVVAADATSQHAVTQALATIEGCEVVLMVLNKAKRTDVGTYYGYYASDGAG